MKILVTGGAGYIGAVLVEALLNENHDVVVLDNFMYEQTSLAHLCHFPRIDIVRGDARDMRIMKHLLKDIDVLIPLAALVGAPLCDSSRANAISTNLDAIINSMSYLSSDQRVIIPISNSGYGVGEKDAHCDENTPMRPISLYGQTKVQAEAAALDRGSAISLRLATVFGMSPRMRLDLLVNDFVWRAVRDRGLVLFEPQFRRNFVHVRDVAAAFVHTLNNWTDMVKSPVYNVGHSNANMTKFELCCLIQQYVPAFRFPEGTGADPDKRDYIVSNAKIEATGWRAICPVEAGVIELIRGYSMYRMYQHGNV